MDAESKSVAGLLFHIHTYVTARSAAIRTSEIRDRLIPARKSVMAVQKERPD